MRFRLDIDCSGEAFGDEAGGCVEAELARVLREVAERLDTGHVPGAFRVRDSLGGLCGAAVFSDGDDADDPEC